MASQQTAYVTPAGLQLIGSPTTVAIPQGSIPPYSGSFIIAPSGPAQVVHPPRLPGPHLLQMQPQHLPIMVPTTLQGPTQQLTTMIPVKAPEAMSPVLLEQKPEEHERETGGGSVEREVQPPPAKKQAVDSEAAEQSSMPTSHTSGSAVSIGARMPYTNISIKQGLYSANMFQKGCALCDGSLTFCHFSHVFIFRERRLCFFCSCHFRTERISLSRCSLCST